MLLLGSTTITIEGIPIFLDHVDEDQFWYLPGPVSLARRQADRRADFTFIQYKPSAVSGGARGGGFLTFSVNLKLDPNLEQRILSKLSSIARGRPKLAVVPFDEGTVQCVALNLQGPGGTDATPNPGGEDTFNAVEQILGASVPSLHGDNSASFSLTLSQEGAIILEKAFEQGTTPVGVIYNLTFTGMRPALDVKITADFKRIYNHFSASVSAQYYFVQAGIEAGFEKLVQDGAIKIEVTNFTGEDDLKEKEKWALDFFKDQLLAQWFQPTLTPGQLAGGLAQPVPLQDILRQGNQLRPPATVTPSQPSATPPQSTSPSPSPTSTERPTEDSGQGTPAPGIHPPTTPTEAGDSPSLGTGGLTPSAGVPPVESAGLGFNPATAAEGLANAAGSAAGSAAGMPVVSFKLKAIRQEELKTLTLQYTAAEATQRTYAPQGFFGLLVSDLEKDSHFVKVDLDSQFFRIFDVTLDAPIDFEQIGLNSIHVALDYGDPDDADNHKHGEFIFDADKQDQQQFSVFMNDSYDTAYKYQVQYHFDPASGWDGEQFSYEYPTKKTEDRSLLLNPFEQLGFLSVEVFPNSIDAGVVESIKVNLHYASPDGWAQEKSFFVTEETPPQTWRLRLSNPTARDYSYHLVHHLKDGTTRSTEPITTRATKLPINDPFEQALDIEFIPLFDSSAVRMVFIDFEYRDSANNYERRERLRLEGNSFDPVNLRISLIDPSLKTFRYRFTFVGTDNRMRREAFVETQETLIPVIEGEQ